MPIGGFDIEPAVHHVETSGPVAELQRLGRPRAADNLEHLRRFCLVRRNSAGAMNALRMTSESSGASDMSWRKTGRGIRWITPPAGIRAENMAACPVSMSSSPRNEPGPKSARGDVLRQPKGREPHDFDVAGLDQNEVIVDVPGATQERARVDDRLRGAFADEVKLRRSEVRISARDVRRCPVRCLGVRSLHTQW